MAIKFILGTNQENCFVTNLSQETFDTINQYFRKVTKQIRHYQNKWFYFQDMKYIVSLNGYQRCVKTEVINYTRTDNVLAMLVKDINVPLNQFPCSTEYHDTRLVEQTDYIINSDTRVEVYLITHNDGEITRECVIHRRKEVPKVIQDLPMGIPKVNFPTKRITGKLIN